MIRLPSLLLATTLLAAPLAAQPAPQFSPQRLEAHVKELADDRYEGRGPATRGETMTVAYLTKQFQAAGLQPGGEVVNGRRQWTQRVPLLKSDIVGTPAVTLRTAAGPRQLTQGNEIAVRAPLNGQTQVRLQNAPLLFAG